MTGQEFVFTHTLAYLFAFYRHLRATNQLEDIHTEPEWMVIYTEWLAINFPNG